VSGRSSRIVTILGWLLTPFVVWAASFCGGWLGALVARRVAGPFGGIEWLVLGAVLGGVSALIVWLRRLRRRDGPVTAGDAASAEEA
jgi:uncharacterized membrane protein